MINLRDIFAVINAKNDNPECCGAQSLALAGSGPGVGAPIALEMTSDYTIAPPDLRVTIEMYASSVTDLRGYEIALTVEGGAHGDLVLDSLDIDASRDDYVFLGRESFEATDAARDRLAAVLNHGDVTHANRVYLGTFRFWATPNTRGDCTMDVSQAGMALDAGGRSLPITVEPLTLTIDR